MTDEPLSQNDSEPKFIATDLDRWMEAASHQGTLQVAESAVLRAVEFMVKTVQMPECEVLDRLAEIDYSRSILVVRLPDTVLIRNEANPAGVWYQDIGYSANKLRAISGFKHRSFYVATGPIPALKVCCRTNREDCQPASLFPRFSPGQRQQLGPQSASAGQEYLVYGKHRLKVL